MEVKCGPIECETDPIRIGRDVKCPVVGVQHFPFVERPKAAQR